MHTELWFGHYLSKVKAGGVEVGAWDLLPLSEDVVTLDNVVDTCINDTSMKEVVVGHALLLCLDPRVKLMPVGAMCG